jgi:2'-5' RNA ligase
MKGSSSEEQIELFALVAYIPGPLAGFVDAVRDELSPGCRLRAHITILPPRELACGIEIASREIQKLIGEARSFRVSAGEVRIFPISEVVHLALEDGLEPLRELHAQLNHDACKAPELWRFEPHITLAQDLEPAAVRPAFELAVRRWREYSGPRSFTLDNLTFVRRALESRTLEDASQDCWVDLSTWELQSPVLA